MYKIPQTGWWAGYESEMTGPVWKNGDIFGIKDPDTDEFTEFQMYVEGAWFSMATRNVALAQGTQLDAFGRLRVSEPRTEFDSKFLSDKQDHYWDESLGGSGTATLSATDILIECTVAATGDSVTRQTFQRFNYQPGKSELIINTGILLEPVADLDVKIGIYDGTDGLYFNSDGSDIAVVVEKNSAQNKTTQANWSDDTMDGNGASGVTLDFDKAQIFVIDMEYLGVGTVRFGFFVDGQMIICHQEHHANSVTGAYMRTPNLPIHYSITSTDGAGTMKQICSTVISEGGSEDLGEPIALYTAPTHVDVNTADTIYGLIGIRLKSTALDVVIKQISYYVYAETNDDIATFLMWQPTVDGSPSWGDWPNSDIQVATGDSTTTVSANGHVMHSSIANDGIGVAAGDLESSLRLGAAIDGTPTEIWLCAMALSSNADLQAAITVRELP